MILFPLIGSTFDHAHVTRCLVLGVNIDRSDYPYTTLMVFLRDEFPQKARVHDIVVY